MVCVIKSLNLLIYANLHNEFSERAQLTDKFVKKMDEGPTGR